MPEETQPQKSKIAEREERILTFWQKDNTFKKSLEKKSPRGEFVFYDGPPFATGLPHYGHILAGTIKDVIPRFKTMQGYHVPRRWGWDCHGLPVENEVEKELGFKTKKDIERYGIGQFNAKAKEAVMRYADDWRAYIERMGRWVDMDNDYQTMDTEYTESVWWSFKTLYDKGLIYQGFKSMHLCPRCETTLSNFEVTQGYKDINDLSVYVKFKLLTSNFQLETSGDVYAVAWTTTPWTLPGNAALAVHPDRDYAFVEITASNSKEIGAGDTFIVGAKEEILKRVFGQESFTFDPVGKVGTFTWKGERIAFSAKKGVKGKDLIGQSYTPIFGYYSNPRMSADNMRINADVGNPRISADKNQRASMSLDKGWRIYGGEFVTEEDGTGIVHIAPAFGEDDHQLSVREKLPFIQHVRTDGTFAPETGEFAGLPAKPKGNPRETDEKIADMLEHTGCLLRREPYTHQYPHCWRCDTPLLNYAAPSWFVNVSAFRDELVRENHGIAWVPEDVGQFRFGNWLAEAKDWAISRARFWGAPIPVWRCERCHAVRAIGSIDELRNKTTERITKVTFLRHGESVKNRKHILDDSLAGSPLTRDGTGEAKEAARRIKAMGGVDAVYASPIERTKETAAIVASRLGKTVTVEEGFREVDSGAWDGKRDDDSSTEANRIAYYALSPEEHYRAKRGGTGESWEAVERRMVEAFERVIVKHRGESVLIVSHEGPLVYLLRALRGFSFEEAERCFAELRHASFAEPIVLSIDHKTGKAIDLHRPHIDDILLACEACAKTTGTGRDLMRRVPEVLDCWFESGSMPYGQAHYPFEFDGKFEPRSSWLRKAKGYPADFIAEGLDQTRGWFYSLLVLGSALFGRSPYKAVVVNGIILAENGAKMSKRLKNYPDPFEVVDKYGADALRYYLLSSPVVRGEELRFSERGVDEVAKKIFNRLDNVLQFYLLYADSSLQAKSYTLKVTHVLDEWILAKLQQLIADVTIGIENYELDKAARPIGAFIEDLSTWYLRRSRERIKSDVLEEKSAALSTLRHVLFEFSKVMAPFAPFFAEYLYQQIKDLGFKIKDSEISSVHLEDWPCAGKVDLRLLKKMQEVRNACSSALQVRAQNKINVRQPLFQSEIFSAVLTSQDIDLLDLYKAEVNVKKVFVLNEIHPEGMKVKLDPTITPELKDEGQFRELVRFVQDMRKRQGFKAGEFATLSVGATAASRRFVEQHEQELARIASLKNTVIQDSITGGEQFQADEIALIVRLDIAG